MSAAQRLVFTLEEPGEDFVCDQSFDILQRVLQPDADLSLDDATQQIIKLLPQGRSYSLEVENFLWTCYEMAQQIPYDHPSMTKLVNLIYACLNSPHLRKGPGLRENPSDRYQKLGESSHDCWNGSDPSEGPSKFVNYQTFEALIFSRGMVKWPFYFMNHILEETFGREKTLCRRNKPADRPADERDAWIQAAAQWILLQGHELHAQIATGLLKAKRWRHWHRSFEAVASGNAASKTGPFSEDTIRLADRAAVAMAALERNKVG